MTKQEVIQVLKSIEDRSIDFPNMTECDWVAIASAKRHLENSLEVKEEPVSNDLEEAADKHLVAKGYLLTTKNGEHLAEIEAKGLFKAGAQWQKKQEVKEVDLEKEVHNAADQYDINNNGNIYWEDIVGFAKHFFELGLKAQKGDISKQ